MYLTFFFLNHQLSCTSVALIFSVNTHPSVFAISMYQLYYHCLNLFKINRVLLKFYLKGSFKSVIFKNYKYEIIIKMQQKQNNGKYPTVVLLPAKSYFSLFLKGTVVEKCLEK